MKKLSIFIFLALFTCVVFCQSSKECIYNSNEKSVIKVLLDSLTKERIATISLAEKGKQIVTFNDSYIKKIKFRNPKLRGSKPFEKKMTAILIGNPDPSPDWEIGPLKCVTVRCKMHGEETECYWRGSRIL